MTAALCYARCQPSSLPIRECKCGCRGRLHGIRAPQLTLSIARLAPLPAPAAQLPLELQPDAPKDSAAAEAEHVQEEPQEGDEQ